MQVGVRLNKEERDISSNTHNLGRKKDPSKGLGKKKNRKKRKRGTSWEEPKDKLLNGHARICNSIHGGEKKKKRRD